jgi:hypothetical protein
VTQRVPVTATSMPEWVRLAATSFNELLRQFVGLSDRTAATETVNAVQNGRLDMLDTHDADHETRIVALETYQSPAFTFTPGALPGSPTEGMTAMDSSDHKLKTWDGTTWNAHW